MQLSENEEIVFKKLLESGVSSEESRFSMRKQLTGLTLKKRIVERKVKFVEYSPENPMTMYRWIQKLQKKGIVNVDITDKWNPKIQLTQIGVDLLEKK